MTSKNEIKDELTDVLTRVVDSADGYEHAAKDAREGRFSVMFRERAAERRGFASELRNHLQSLGTSAAEDGSLLASAHRAFVDLKDSVTGDNDESIRQEVERGESRLLKEYDDALEDLSPEDAAYTLLSRQRQSVLQALNSVKGQGPVS